MTEDLTGVVERKRRGIDCTEEESSAVLRYFDNYSSVDDASRDEFAALFPPEFDQWTSEFEAGLR